MAIYYFHLCNGGDVLLDPEGRKLKRGMIEAAALVEARAIIAADARNGSIDLDQLIDVQDSSGKLVHRIALEDAVQVNHAPPRTT